ELNFWGADPADKREGFNWVTTKWYRVYEIEDRDDVEYNIYDHNPPGEAPNCDYWYAHVFIYTNNKDNPTKFKTSVRTARKEPNGYDYKKYGLPCEDGRRIEFVNTPKEVYTDVDLSGIKKIILSDNTESTEPIPDGMFKFSLYNYLGSNTFDTTPKVIDGVSQEKWNVGNTVTFDTFKVKFLDGTGYNNDDKKLATESYLYFLIKETDCKDTTAYTMDDSQYVAKVIVKKTGNGLTSSVEYYKFTEKDGNGNVIVDVTKAMNGTTDEFTFKATDFAFRNKYNPNPTSTVIYGAKVMENRDLHDDEFTFKIENSTGDNADPSFDKFTNTVVTNKSGKFSFTTREYTASDLGKSYTYRVSELVPQRDELDNPIPNVYYDETIYDVTVTITRNSKGDLIATPDRGATEEAALTFTNTYSTEVTFKAQKKYADGLLKKDKDKKEKFKFYLKEYSDSDWTTLVPDSTREVEVTGENIGTFGEKIDYDKEGKHYYTINEDVTGCDPILDNDGKETGYYTKNGIKYDGRIYYILVDVKKNSEGNLAPHIKAGYKK
ncbi:MAG: hypothetical protein IK123_05845, partial [Lachnospiraceae bacterium]|nr:hypothetical protein [Lachnospiraceae bacterium]